MIGTKLAHYEITSHLGMGGMGEVYQATDSKLGRSVAIKLLPEAFTHDHDRAARFEREARVLASLNHPKIATIYGIEESRGRKFLVMELVGGETLAERIKHGAIPVDEALGIATQIAEGLESAHEKGIVHRDLKPANIKVTLQSQVKVLDFGLAKAFAGEAAEVNLANSPTLSMAATKAGVILGTAAYMSPEQAKGKETDHTTDIWAFGCVLYEMLTGRATFEGETLGEILGSVFKSEPDWTALPADTPPLVRSLLRRCLQKERHRRFHSIADARLDIEDALTQPAIVPVASAAPPLKRLPWLWLGVASLAIAGASSFTSIYFRPASNPLETRLQVLTPPGDETVIAISPDGRNIVYSATTNGKSQFWLRSLQLQTAQPLEGTEGAASPFWSTDSQSLGFFTDSKLKRIDITGGTARTLADATGDYGGTWNANGVIVFSPSNGSSLYSIPASGGSPTEVTSVQFPQQAAHRWPYFLSDNRHFLFFVTGTPEVAGVYVGSLDSKDVRRLLNADSAATFAPPGYLLFVRQETLFAQRLNVQKVELAGDPIPIADHVYVNYGIAGQSAFSPSAAGLLAFREAVVEPRQLIWFDRSGRQTGVVGEPDTAALSGVALSPDGSMVAVVRTVSGNMDVWLIDTARGTPRRFTFDAAVDRNPHWSPDGTRIVFESFRIKSGIYNFFEKAVSGGGPEKLLLESPENKNISDWSPPDGRFILYAVQSAKVARDLWALPLGESQKPFVVAQTNYEETGGRFSPDGHWVAYQSDESGRNEIYVKPFPGPGGNTPVSTNGGSGARWARGGRELLYLGPDNRLMAVQVTLSSSGIQAGTPAPLFTIRAGSQFDVTPDGQRFLINSPIGEPSASAITVIQNWKPRP